MSISNNRKQRKGPRKDVSSSKKNILIAILITTITMAAFWLYSPPRFAETNDDVVMASILYGYNGGDYDGHMYFINICLGVVLEFCVRLFPVIPWYTVTQCGTIYVSFIVIVYLLLQKFKGARAIFPIVTLMTFFGYQCFCSLQFTKTAAIGVIGGLLLLFYAIENQSKWPTYLLAFVLTLMGSMFRISVFKMMLAFFCVVGICMLIKVLKEKQWKELIRLCVPFVLIIAVCFGVRFIHQHHYNQSEDWRAFAEYNIIRADLIDRGFPDYETNAELYESLNITYNDYLLYSNGGNYADPDLFTPEVMSALAAAKAPKVIDQAFFKGYVADVLLNFSNYFYFPALCVAFVLALLSISKKRKLQILVVFYELVLFLGVQLYFFYSNRYHQSRVDMGITLALYLILFLHSFDSDAVVPTKAKASPLLGASLLFTTVPYHVSVYRTNKEQLEMVAATQVYELLSSDPSHYYLYPSAWNTFPDKMYDVFTVEPFGCGSNRSIMGTWRSQTPPIKAKWARYGITNPYRDITNNPDIFLLCTSDTSLNRVRQHIWDHYYPNANAFLVKDIEGTYQIYRVSTTGVPAVDTSTAIDGSAILNYDVSYSTETGKLIIAGYLYGEGMNSYASNIYVSITGNDNVEYLCYATQYDGMEHNDYMNGSYGCFYTELQIPNCDCAVRLYLEVDGTLYYIDAEPFYLK